MNRLKARTVQPETELPGILSKLRAARSDDPNHDDKLINRLGKPVIHIDCFICTAEKRLNYLLEILSSRMAKS